MIAIEHISPVLYQRLTRDEGQLYDRMPLYIIAWNSFLDNPLFGSSFAIYHDKTFSYAHNIILDSMMQLGIIGLGFIFYIYKHGVKMVLSFFKKNSNLIWVGFFMLKSMMGLMVSGSIYTTPEFSIIFVFAALNYNNLINNTQARHKSTTK